MQPQHHARRQELDIPAQARRVNHPQQVVLGKTPRVPACPASARGRFSASVTGQAGPASST